jgi:hypothetical protein
MPLRKQLSVTLCRPCSQAVVETGHVDDSIMHLYNDRRNWRLLCDLYLIDRTTPTGPVVPQLVLSLPIRPTSSFDKMFVV